ncbi:MAG: hypothetical protein AAB842_02380, partial [Patescibacteria group bacterium]
MSNTGLKEILIVSITPYFMEKTNFWFTENLAHIKKSQKTQAFWQDNTLFLEAGQKRTSTPPAGAGHTVNRQGKNILLRAEKPALPIKISEILKKIDEMGYEKVFKVTEPGEFSQIGGIIEIFPINSFFAMRLDFLGNTIETIEKLPIEIENEE